MTSASREVETPAYPCQDTQVTKPSPARITRDLIAQAAIDLKFEDLTVSSVARRLGVKHSSLYRHVSSRQELVQIAMERLASEVKWPELSGDWEEYLTILGDFMWGLYQDYPGLPTEFRAATEPSSFVIYVFAAATEYLIKQGFDDREAVLVVDALADLTIDSFFASRRESRRNFYKNPRTAEVPTFGVNRPEGLYVEHPQQTWQNLAVFYRSDGRAKYEAKRSLLLDGVRTRRQRRKQGDATSKIF